MQQYIWPILKLHSSSLILEFEQGNISPCFEPEISEPSFLNQQSPYRTLKIFKVLNKREER